MIYHCVGYKKEETKRGQEFATLWFKLDPNNKFEVPEKIVTFSRDIMLWLRVGGFELWNKKQEAEVVLYPLGRKMKYPNGKVVDTLRLFCLKKAVREAIIVDGKPVLDNNGKPKTKFVKWVWQNGYSPEQLAMNHLRILTPIS